MKKSNLLLIAALALVLISLTAYNQAISTAFARENFKDPFRAFTNQPLQDFDEIEVYDMNVIVQPGTYAVRVSNNILDRISIKKEGRRLIMSVIPLPNQDNSWLDPAVYISCPNLKVIRTNCFYTTDGRLIAEVKKSQAPFKYATYTSKSEIKGFMLDSLQVEAINSAAILLENNTIHKLRANIGQGLDQVASLTISPGNKIKSANLNIRNSSSLNLNNTKIPNLKYELSDSAQITLSGASLAVLKKQ